MKLKEITVSMSEKVDLYKRAKKALASGEDFKSVSDELVQLVLKKYRGICAVYRPNANEVTLYKAKNKYLTSPGIRITRTLDVVTLTIDNAQGSETTQKFYKVEVK